MTLTEDCYRVGAVPNVGFDKVATGSMHVARPMKSEQECRCSHKRFKNLRNPKPKALHPNPSGTLSSLKKFYNLCRV